MRIETRYITQVRSRADLKRLERTATLHQLRYVYVHPDLPPRSVSIPAPTHTLPVLREDADWIQVVVDGGFTALGVWVPTDRTKPEDRRPRRGGRSVPFVMASIPAGTCLYAGLTGQPLGVVFVTTQLELQRSPIEGWFDVEIATALGRIDALLRDTTDGIDASTAVWEDC